MNPIAPNRLAGILVPAFALRSADDLGIGDTQSIREMIDWSAKHHFSVIQLLPINETGDDNSPYNAISSTAIEPSLLAVSPEHLPDLPKKSFQEMASPELLKELRKGAVQYRKVKPLKLQLLREAFQNFLQKHDSKNTPRAKVFRAFITSQSEWIADYSLFRALMSANQNLPLWDRWPTEHQSPSQARAWILSLSPEEREHWDHEILFFSYIQWIAFQQWTGLKKYADGKKVRLMGDIPYGISRYSADVWAFRHLFDLRWSCGAPPESFFKPDLFTERWGQNWGIPLYRWNRMQEDGHAWWRCRIRSTAALFHEFRIDHVLGFYRIYSFPWKPEENGIYTHLSHDEARQKAGDLPRFWPGDDYNPPSQAEVNQRQGEELLHMVIQAGEGTGLVAEDLGMVPNYVRPSLLQMGIPGFKIPVFERNQDGSYKGYDTYHEISITTFATHDHEPAAAIWKRWQTVPEGPAEMRHLLHWIGWNEQEAPKDFTPELHQAICRKLLESPSRYVLFMITDLFAGTQRFNVPGPMSDSNWTERLERTVSELDTHAPWAACTRAVEKAIQSTSRG